jgi:hypothetical protein
MGVDDSVVRRGIVLVHRGRSVEHKVEVVYLHVHYVADIE